MSHSLEDIQKILIALLKAHAPLLKAKGDFPGNVEVSGTKEVMQGKQQVPGHYFASVIPKPKDIRFYYFPIYTHVAAFPDLSPELKKCLKGKSCFHIKKLTPEMERELAALIQRGVELYRQNELI